MNERTVNARQTAGLLMAVVGVACSAGVAAAENDRRGVVPAPMQCGITCTDHMTQAQREARALEVIRSTVFATLTPEQRRVVVQHETGMWSSDSVELAPPLPPMTGTEYDRVAHLISPVGWARASEGHRQILLNALETGIESPGQLALCFAPGTDPEYAVAVDAALYGLNPIAFQIFNRWGNTATDGNTGSQGDNITITYGFPADGSNVPDQGFGSGGSQFNAWMDGVYGSRAVWQPLYDQEFQRWGDLIGVTYVFEPNDDGVSLSNGNPGVLGVRADVRIGAIDFQGDGNGGVLAYNNFPNHGDMIFDAFDTFYNATGGNSIRLRNVISHEHGHGLGMAHVCPSNGTKLMEPFINTGFLGPQLDDVLNGQRNYGDSLEPNNSIAQATDLGSTSSGVFLNDISLDDNSDTDVFEVNISEPRRLLVSAIPQGESYLEGPQTQACNTGSTFDSLNIHNLAITVLNSGGGVVGSSNTAGEGQTETIDLVLENAGTYYVSITGDSTNNIQLYDLNVSDLDLPFIPVDIDTPNGVPADLDPGVTTDFAVTIDPNEESLVANSATLRYRNMGDASYQSTPLAFNGGQSYTATLPSFLCEDGNVEFFVEVEGDMSGVLTLPADGENAPFTAIVGELAIPFEDNFQADQGWSVSGDASDGQWTRGVPASDGSRSDPTVDGDGSGSAYLTDNAPGNTDVDGGSTILTSPVFDFSEGGTVSWFYWLDDSAGASLDGGDGLFVEVSSNGGSTWSRIRTYTTAAQSWRTDSIDVPSALTSENYRIRFIAADVGAGSLVEAAVDGVQFSSTSCTDPVDDCDADFNDDDAVNVFDILDFLAVWNVQGPGSDVNDDTNVDIFDILAFLDIWNAGCP